MLKRGLVVQSFFKEISLSIVLVLLGFFLIMVTIDGLNEARFLGQFDYRMGTLLSVVLLRTPDYFYRLLPICTLIGAVFALSNMAARSELIVWRASGLSVRLMMLIVVSLGGFFALGLFLVGELGIARGEETARSIKSTALHSDQHFKQAGGFWGRQNLEQGQVRMINVRTVVDGKVLKDVRIFELNPDFSLRSLIYAQSAVELPNRGGWQLREVSQVALNLSDSGVVMGQVSQNFSELPVNLGDYDLESIRFLGSSYVSLTVNQLSHRIKSAQQSGQRSREFELGWWQKIFYPLSIFVMLLLALPFAFIKTRSGGVGVRVMAGIFLGLLFFICNAMVQFLGPLLSVPAGWVAAMPSLVFLFVALVWLRRVSRVS